MPKIKRTRLTVKKVSEIKAPKTGQRFVWDLEVPGLAVRVTFRGARSFIFERKFKGRTLRLTIGSCTAWRLPQAREEARRLQRLIDQGIDPREERRALEAAQRLSGMIVSEVWGAYLDAHRDQWGERHMRDNLYLARAPEASRPGGILWTLLQKNLGEIDIFTLLKWAQKALEAPNPRLAINQGRNTALRQAYMRLRAFWRWACQREEYSSAMSDPSMFNHSDLKALIPKVRAKNDVLEIDQLISWFEAVTKINNPVIAAYLQILLLTGARRNELGMLKWGDIDFQWKSIRMKDKVEEEGRKIPLTPYVEYLLSGLARRNDWVFSSLTSASGRLMEPRIAHKEALSVAGLPSNLSLHGLRRSFTTLSEWIEIPSGVTAQIQGHRPSAVQEKHYIRRSLGLLAKWHRNFEARILEQAGIDFNPETAKGGLRIV